MNSEAILYIEKNGVRQELGIVKHIEIEWRDGAVSEGFGGLSMSTDKFPNIVMEGTLIHLNAKEVAKLSGLQKLEDAVEKVLSYSPDKIFGNSGTAVTFALANPDLAMQLGALFIAIGELAEVQDEVSKTRVTVTKRKNEGYCLDCGEPIYPTTCICDQCERSRETGK